MAIFRLSDELSQQRTVSLENTFILEYMPFAPEGFVKIYLFGLYMTGTEDADFDSIALALQIDKKTVTDAFEYWKAQELVRFSPEPLMIEFLPVQPYSKKIKLYNPAKYQAFNDQLHALIKDRDISKGEYDNYYNLMESYHIEDNALLTIIGYCIRLQGTSVRYQYILTVAKNFAEQGLITYDAISEHLSEMDLHDADLRAVLKALKLKRAADHYDRDLFLKWKNEYGFKLDVIISVAKEVKRGGIQTLDMLITRYYDHHLFTFAEIERYETERKQLYDLTRHVCNILGQKYDLLDSLIENYVSGWIAMGFSHETIIEIARLCLRMNARSFERMNETAAGFYKKGIISHSDFTAFIVNLNKTDKQIKELLDIMGAEEWVDKRERDFYNTWTANWKMPRDLLIYGAELSRGKANPISYMNVVLAAWHNSGVKTVDEAKAAGTKPAAEVAATAHPFTNPDNFVKRNYTSEELNEMLNKYNDDEL